MVFSGISCLELVMIQISYILRLLLHHLRLWSALKQFRLSTVRLSDPIMTNQNAFAELESNVFLGSMLVIT